MHLDSVYTVLIWVYQNLPPESRRNLHRKFQFPDALTDGAPNIDHMISSDTPISSNAPTVSMNPTSSIHPPSPPFDEGPTAVDEYYEYLLRRSPSPSVPSTNTRQQAFDEFQRQLYSAKHDPDLRGLHYPAYKLILATNELNHARSLEDDFVNELAVNAGEILSRIYKISMLAGNAAHAQDLVPAPVRRLNMFDIAKLAGEAIDFFAQRERLEKKVLKKRKRLQEELTGLLIIKPLSSGSGAKLISFNVQPVMHQLK
ncbi:hypothetical protein CPC08DRAFT_768948 [Agrocybe pediades]|nr:hypothetical protein CPC08DRAFT_768948 [Agrocybe pediades]